MANGTFIKVYNVQPNEAQRQAMGRALKSQTEGFLLMGNNVKVTTDSATNLFNNDKNAILVTFEVEGKPEQTFQRFIGVRGGIKLI